MNSQTIQYVALDFDLTFFDYARPQDTILLVPWLERLADQGIKVGISSGRSIESLKYEVEALGITWGRPFPDFVVEYECLIRTNDGESLPGTEGWNETILRESKFLKTNALPLLNKVRDTAIREGVKIERDILIEPGNITICLESPAAAEKARLKLAAQLQRKPCRFEVRRNHHILIVAMAGRNKGAALHQLQRAMNVAPQDVLVIGDSLNDLSMMNPAFGFQCATVANADPQVIKLVRERGGFVASDRVAHGILQVFSEVFGHAAPLLFPAEK